MSNTIEAVLKSAAQRLAESGSDSPSLDAAVLLCHALDKPRSYLLTWPDKEMAEEQKQAFEALMARRLGGEPVAYILGEREFWSLPLKVSTATLIPRPDTERLVELALERIPSQPCQVLDLGTGTGAIALALASELPQHPVTGVDLMPEAAKLAAENAQRLGLTNARFAQGSWFSPLTDGTKFACIVSNPPYIEKDDPHLTQGDVRFEPLSALVAEEKGMADLTYIAGHGRNFLETGGWLLMEHGFEQGQAVRAMMQDFGYTEVATAQDYAGNDRVTYGRWAQ